MAQGRKYATLPDLDSAPDIYETPAVVTAITTTDDDDASIHNDAPSPSDADAKDPSSSAIDRNRLQPAAARTHFLGARVDARNVDFSDRIDGVRRSYRTSSRRRGGGRGGGVEDVYGDFSDDEDLDEEGNEGLDRRLARLRREVEEVKAAVERRQEEGVEPDRKEEELGGIAGMARVLREVQISQEAWVREGAAKRRKQQENGAGADSHVNDASDVATATSTEAFSRDDERILTKAASFDERLAVLEKALGASAAALNEKDSSTVSSRGVIPSLDTLEKQITALTSASSASLDAMARQIHQLTQDAERLEEARSAARAAQEALKSKATPPARTAVASNLRSASAETQSPTSDEDPEQAARIDALYGTLATIETLSPLLTPVLERLRSLRLIHADAAAASENLKALEKRQAQTAEEIKKWREGLERVLKAMEGGKGTTQGNAAAVEAWVKELEIKVKKLGS